MEGVQTQGTAGSRLKKARGAPDNVMQFREGSCRTYFLDKGSQGLSDGRMGEEPGVRPV